MFKRIKQKAYNKGFSEGYLKGYDEAIVFSEEYYEGNKTSKKTEVANQLIHKPTKLDDFRELEKTMTWVNAVFEVADSDYFRSYLFENNTVEELNNLMLYLDYLNKSESIQNFYPYTSIYIPELLLSLEEVCSNKLVIQQAEECLRL